MMMEMVMVGIGVGLLAVSNIILGATLAGLEHDFDKYVFYRGVLKAVMIIISLFLASLAGYLNPDILAVDLGGTQLNLLLATKAVLVGAFIAYSGMVIAKLLEVFNIKKVKND